MIHILTVHWKSDDWIDLQLEYIKYYVNSPYKIYAYLNHVPNNKVHSKKYHYSSDEDIESHAIKLNLLAEKACLESVNDSDLLMFIDGDAFPIADISNFVDKSLKNHKLTAVQRYENNGDIQPHPCFCMTTVGFWKEIQGDWTYGKKNWKDIFGNKVWDVGGQLLYLLEQKNEPWYKLLRSNKDNSLHPLMFGVYDDVVYHHGCGFRDPEMRIDELKVKNHKRKVSIYKKSKKFLSQSMARRFFLPLNKTIKINRQKSKNMFKKIKNDFYFFKKLIK